MRILFAALLIIPAALAGCVATNGVSTRSVGGLAGLPASDHLGCLPAPTGSGVQCNFDAMTTNSQGNEVSIAVNPKDPLNIVAGAKDYTANSTGGQCVWDGVYVTKDGGETWKDYNIPGSPWLLLTNPSQFTPTAASTLWCATDPSIAFGPDGTLYYAVMAYQGDPVTASHLGKDQTCAVHNMSPDTVACSGVNDIAYNRVSQIVAVSTDGGETISRMTVVDQGTFPLTFHDREWIDVADDGTIYDAWTTGALEGNILYRSTDHGQTWQGPAFLDGGPTGSLLGGPSPGSLFVAAGPNGTVYVSGWGGSGSTEGAYLTKSTDHGATFTPWAKVGGFPDKGMNATYRTGGIAMVAADHVRANVYVAWHDTHLGERDIYVAASHDGGATWSNATRVNDDLAGSHHDHFDPAIAVSPSGIVDVAWYDRRDDPQNALLNVYATSSLDFGKTWSPNLRVTEVSSDPNKSHHQGGFTFIGDYMDIDSSDRAAHPVWVDTRYGKADVFTAAILRTPSAHWSATGKHLAAPFVHKNVSDAADAPDP
ncbi:MAG: sialidase family protein [Thermoplasmatota archaeon]